MKKIMRLNIYKVLLILMGCIILVTLRKSIVSGEDKKVIKVTAHRGDSAQAPENTIPSLERAIEAAADYAEIDVRQTKDNVLVLLHDSSLVRTTGLEGEVKDYNYNEIKDLDAGKWFYQKDTDIAIPTLEQVLQYCKGRIKLNIEIKNDSEYFRITDQVVALIHKYKMNDSCMVTSTNYAYLQEVMGMDASIRTGIILDNIENLSFYKDVDLYSIMFSHLTKEAVDQIHKSGKEIHAWTIDGKGITLEARKLNVDNIITNNPRSISNILK